MLFDLKNEIKDVFPYPLMGSASILIQEPPFHVEHKLLKSMTRIYFHVFLIINGVALFFFFMTMSNDFYINRDLGRSLEAPALTMAYGLFLVYVGWVVLRVISSTERNEKLVFLILGFMWAFLPFMMAFIFSFSFPEAILKISNINNGLYFEKPYRIRNKEIVRKKFGNCYGINFETDEEDSHFASLGGCIPYDNFKNLKTGDVVIIYGKRSVFGIRVYGYKYQH